MTEIRIAITLLAVVALIEAGFILRLMIDLVRLEAAQDQKITAIAELADKARKLGQAAQRAVSRFKQSLQGDLK